MLTILINHYIFSLNLMFIRTIQHLNNFVFETIAVKYPEHNGWEFSILISLHPNVVDLRYFKHWILWDKILNKFEISKEKHLRLERYAIIKFEFVAETQFLL